MALSDAYDIGVIDALEKVAGSMTMDQARKYVKSKDDETASTAFAAGAGGLGTSVVEGLGDFTPMSGKELLIPGALGGYSLSKLKDVFTSPKEMYVRDGDLTGRSMGGIAGGVGGAGLGAGIGHLVDSSGWGMGIGSLLGGLLGQGVGQVAGDSATEFNNRDVIREAEIEASQKRESERKRKFGK